jgi:hypothetical protein
LLDGALQNAQLMAECEDLELQRRTAPEGSEKRGQRADNRSPKGNRRKKDNSRFINQIGFCGNHTRKTRARLWIPATGHLKDDHRREDGEQNLAA